MDIFTLTAPIKHYKQSESPPTYHKDSSLPLPHHHLSICLSPFKVDHLESIKTMSLPAYSNKDVHS